MILDVNRNGLFDPDLDVVVDADSNKKQTQGLAETITVAALGNDGRFSSYSNWGANVFVTGSVQRLPRLWNSDHRSDGQRWI